MTLPHGNRRHALLAIAGLAVAISLLVLWLASHDTSHVQRYETQQKTLVFDFSSAKSRTEATSVEFSLTAAEVKGMHKAQLFVKQKETAINSYPGSASGSLQCTTLIFINDKEWDREHTTYEFRATGPDWPGNKDEAERSFYDVTYPYTIERSVATDSFNRSGGNHLRATVTCTSHVDSTGPMMVLLEFGPIFALVTT